MHAKFFICIRTFNCAQRIGLQKSMFELMKCFFMYMFGSGFLLPRLLRQKITEKKNMFDEEKQQGKKNSKR